MKQKLSELMDGELGDLDMRRTLKKLSEDVELRGVWGRYHVIRTAMTRQLSVLADMGLAERVMSRLEAETAPADARLRVWPLAGGFAVAASLVAAAILTLQPFDQTITGPTAAIPSATNVASTMPSATVAPVAASDREERLSFYLVGHNEFMPTAGMGGMLPYVRVVSHAEDK
jgi:sigma-E factor negative regulatory protein RseA